MVYGSAPAGQQPQLTCTVARFNPNGNALSFQTTTHLSSALLLVFGFRNRRSLFTRALFDQPSHPSSISRPCDLILKLVSYSLLMPTMSMTLGACSFTGTLTLLTVRGLFQCILSWIPALFVVHLTSFPPPGIHFGDVLTIEAGIADSIYTNAFANGGVPFIDSAAISSNKMALAWADFSNSGALTAAIITVDGARNLHSSPLYVLGQPLTLNQLFNYTVSVAGLSIPSNELYGAVIIDRKIANDAASSGNVALIEVAPRAFGIASQSGLPGGKVSVTISGQLDLPASFPSPLKPGYLYYARTDGTLEAGPLAGTVDRAANYITLSDGSIVSADSAVAVGISPRQLYVLPSYH